jgi:hypothetical protein
MKELTIQHVPAKGRSRAQVHVSYKGEGVRTLQAKTSFKFEITPEQRDLIQWYLETYLEYPWGEWKTRAASAEQVLDKLGADLFTAVFDAPTIRRLYASVENDLADTRIVVEATADATAGLAIPWELMHDPVRKPYGHLAARAYAFVRSQPDPAYAAPAPSDTFNILLIICRPGGRTDVPFQSVARPLLERFQPHRDKIRVDVLRPPTPRPLTQASPARSSRPAAAAASR